MAGKGGARPGSGAKKGYRGILADELNKEIIAQTGRTVPQILAEMGLKLFNDFNSNPPLHVKEAVSFWNKMGDRIITPLVQEIDDGKAVMTAEEIRQEMDNLITRAVLSKKTKEEDKLQ